MDLEKVRQRLVLERDGINSQIAEQKKISSDPRATAHLERHMAATERALAEIDDHLNPRQQRDPTSGSASI